MTSGAMPTGPPIKYIVREDGCLHPKALPGTSWIAKECLEYLGREYFHDLQTAYNLGEALFKMLYFIMNTIQFFTTSTHIYLGEYRIGRRRFTADGFSAAQRTVVQFDGKLLTSCSLT